MRILHFGNTFDELPNEIQRQIFLETTQHSMQRISNIVQKIDALIKTRDTYTTAVKNIKGPFGSYRIYSNLARTSPDFNVRRNAKYILNNEVMPKIFRYNTIVLKTKRKIKGYQNEIDKIKDQLYFNYGYFKRL